LLLAWPFGDHGQDGQNEPYLATSLAGTGAIGDLHSAGYSRFAAMSAETIPQFRFTKAKSGQLNRVAQFSIIDYRVRGFAIGALDQVSPTQRLNYVVFEAHPMSL
jgi:hypothetical protein